MQTDILTAENAALGACLVDVTLWPVILDRLDIADLASDAGRAILQAARTLDMDGQTPDAPAIAERVKPAGIERDYLFELMTVSCHASQLEQNIELIYRAARLRSLSQLGQDMTERARRGDSPNEIIGDVEKALTDLDGQTTGDLIDGTVAAVRFYEFRDSGASVAVPTGFAGLDKLLGGGMLKNGLYILAARPGCGKTTLALQIADYAARDAGAVLFVSLEMDDVQLQARRLARVTGIPANHLLMGSDLGERWPEVAQANKRLATLPLSMNRRVRCSVSDVRAMARKVKDLRLVVIDYLGLLRPEGKTVSRYEQITAISGDLKALARSLKVPVLCLAQLNRASEQRADKKPTLADLRDSGAIEQDADAVLLLHREDMYWMERPDEDEPVIVECNLAKHRHGSMGQLSLGLDLPTGTFAELRR